ncbi:MAG: sulfate transporter [Acidiferrobacteraceae bacterium]|nr:sulfate transporter [Acidiferrobacteraceae bacterium]
MLVTGVLLAGLPFLALADRAGIVIQSTTSTANSGLYDHLLPLFEKAHDIKVNVVAVGTGQAIRNAARGDGDVLLVHAESDEKEFVRDGWGVRRFDLMFNDFVLVGPASDPASLSEAENVRDALVRISREKALFASRGDDSGTHKKELALWDAAGIDPSDASRDWYRETGSGMGATLNIAVGMGAYCLTDRATWISFANKRGLKVLYEDDPPLFNQYGIILINPKRHPHVNALAGQKFIDWMIGKEGQRAIASFRSGGQQLFFPNASP